MKRLLLALNTIPLLIAGLFLSIPTLAYAQATSPQDVINAGQNAAQNASGNTAAKSAVCEGISITGGSCDQQPGQPSINSTVTLVINILSFIVGLAAVIVIIIAGLRYITSGGDSSSVSGAKNAIIYAVIGLVIVALAQVIVQFVLNRVTQQPPAPQP